MKNEIQFNIAGKDKRVLITVTGKIVDIEGLKCVLHKAITRPFNTWDEFTPKEMHNFWQVSEYTTGANVAPMFDQRKKAIEAAKRSVVHYGLPKIKQIIAKFSVINLQGNAK